MPAFLGIVLAATGRNRIEAALHKVSCWWRSVPTRRSRPASHPPAPGSPDRQRRSVASGTQPDTARARDLGPRPSRSTTTAPASTSSLRPKSTPPNTLWSRLPPARRGARRSPLRQLQEAAARCGRAGVLVQERHVVSRLVGDLHVEGVAVKKAIPCVHLVDPFPACTVVPAIDEADGEAVVALGGPSLVEAQGYSSLSRPLPV